MNNFLKILAGICFLTTIFCVYSTLSEINMYLGYLGTIFIFSILIYFILETNKDDEENIKNKYINQINSLQKENQFIYNILNDEQKKLIYIENQKSFNKILEDYHTNVVKGNNK